MFGKKINRPGTKVTSTLDRGQKLYEMIRWGNEYSVVRDVSTGATSSVQTRFLTKI